MDEMEYDEREKVEERFTKDLMSVIYGKYGFHENYISHKRKQEIVREIMKMFLG